jgi:hypothetical protein
MVDSIYTTLVIYGERSKEEEELEYLFLSFSRKLTIYFKTD